MALFKRKESDPISERARALNAEIAALESKIKRLDSQLHSKPQPRLRSTAVPHGATISHHAAQPAPAAPAAPRNEPVFEDVRKEVLESRAENAVTSDHFNELGVRKYDLPALWRKIRNAFSGPAASNPRLVSYLAAGGVQGLRPLRYEKRVARNRFIAFAAGLLLLLIGLLFWFGRSR